MPLDPVEQLDPVGQLDPVEFDVFYRAKYAGLLRLCFLATLDREAAADATQEAMIRAWQRWDTLGAEAPLAWVRRVAINLCHSRWRRLQRELHLAPRLAVSHAQPAEIRGLDLLRSLRTLSPRQRQAVALHYWADLSVESVAAIMDVSTGTIKQHLSRARAQLVKTNSSPTDLEAV